jgi:hypothetical protein
VSVGTAVPQEQRRHDDLKDAKLPLLKLAGFNAPISGRF